MTHRHFYAVLIVLASLVMVHVAHIANAVAQGYLQVFVPVEPSTTAMPTPVLLNEVHL
jgi:hypothetical protein